MPSDLIFEQEYLAITKNNELAVLNTLKTRCEWLRDNFKESAKKTRELAKHPLYQYAVSEMLAYAQKDDESAKKYARRADALCDLIEWREKQI
jgi:hypothetical protein